MLSSMINITYEQYIAVCRIRISNICEISLNETSAKRVHSLQFGREANMGLMMALSGLLDA